MSTCSDDDAKIAAGRNAQLSWIPRESSNLRLEETQIFPGINQDAIENLITMVRHINRTFPFYLPSRYSSMDAEEMQRKSTDGQYWTNSCFALIATVMHSTDMWHLSNLIKHNKPFVKMTPFLSESIKEKLQDDVQEADSALEFLSDSWVFVQVTHCPGVLNQWLVAAYGEMLRFQQQISDFHYLPYTTTFKEAVTQLHAAESVKVAIARSFHVVNKLISIKGTDYFMCPKSYPLVGFKQDMDAILCQLKKVRSEKGQNVIKALKRLCWNGSNKSKLLKPIELCMKCVFYDASLSYRYLWELNIRNHFFLAASLYHPCSNKKECPNCIQLHEENIKQTKEFNGVFRTRPIYKDVNLTKNKMVQFYDDHLKDRFPPKAKNDGFIAHLINKEMLFLHWKFESIEDLRSNLSQLQASDFGVVFGIMMLEIELEQSNHLSAMAAKLSELSGLATKAVDSVGPDFTYREITDYLANEKFPASNLTEVLHKRNQPEERKMMGNIHWILRNTRLKLQIKDIDFEYRIAYDSWHFIYRLMPCFVASYLDLCKDDSVSAEAKDFYSFFLSVLLDDLAENTGIVCGGVNYRSNCYLKWKFESVARELKFRLYGASKSPTVVQQLQEKCFDVLTDPLGRVDETKCDFLNQKWRILLYDFSDRMQLSLLQSFGLPLVISENAGVSKDKEYALSTLCRILAEEIFQHSGFEDTPKFSDSSLLLSAIFSAYVKSNKVKIIKLCSSASKCKTWLDVQLVIKTEIGKLSEQQRFGIALYLCLSTNDKTAFKSRHRKQKIRRYSWNDWMELLNYQILCGDFATAAEKIPVLLNPSLSQVSLEFAKETAPTCYSPIINRVVNGKVSMGAPGQNTFCPIPHCRWCGQVQDPSAMRVCHFCTDSPKYPDTHLFCSSECEDQAMKHQHGKQHAEFLEYKLGLEKVCPMFDSPLESPNDIMYKVKPPPK